MMRLVYSSDAEKNLARLPAAIAERIHEKIQWFAGQEDPIVFAKPLHGDRKGCYRFRIGDYRAVFTIQNGKVLVLLVLVIQHRKEVYR